jgi:hypothetical protein
MNRPVENNFAHGIVGHAIWPCTLNPKAGMVHCGCSDFIMSVDGKTGNTVLRCP